MHMILNTLYTSGYFNFEISIFSSKFNNFTLKNRDFISKVNFLIVKLFDSCTMINRFL